MGKRIRLLVIEQYFAITDGVFCSKNCARLDYNETKPGPPRCTKFGTLKPDRLVTRAIRSDECLAAQSRADGDID
jgi:hypothetical protein